MATTQDLGLLTRKLGAADYDPSRYVSEISQRCVGGEEVLAQRKVIQGLSDDTNNQLKKNVYQNYSQFIETAKEISHLESDMFRLSHMITEQRKMLTGLVETSLLGDRVPLTHTTVEAEGKEEEAEEVLPKPNQGRQELLDLMEKVEGGREVIQVQNRFVLYHGDLVEMDVSDNSALHRVHGYLCNDALVLATWLREKRGPVRFQLSSVAPLPSLAMVNVRDLAGVKHAWKLLVPPDPRLFQCRDEDSKKAWLAAYDEAKALQKTGGQPQPGTFTRMESLRPKRKNADVANPFGEDDDDDDEEEEVAEAELELPEWLVELGDSLDVHIAQREFEQAVELLGEAGRELAALASCAAVAEARAVAASRKAALIQVLRGELTVTPEKSLQGGPRTARRAVALLSSLDRSREARDLLLAHRTAVLRHTVRNVRPEGSTVVYVQRLATAFFQQTAEAAREFDKCFPGLPARSSALLMWAEEEVEWFAERLDKQVFNSQSAVAVVAACVAFLRKQAERLVAQGLDLLFMLDARLQASVEKVVMEARDKAVEAIKLRCGVVVGVVQARVVLWWSGVVVLVLQVGGGAVGGARVQREAGAGEGAGGADGGGGGEQPGVRGGGDLPPHPHLQHPLLLPGLPPPGRPPAPALLPRHQAPGQRVAGVGAPLPPPPPGGRREEPGAAAAPRHRRRPGRLHPRLRAAARRAPLQ